MLEPLGFQTTKFDIVFRRKIELQNQGAISGMFVSNGNRDQNLVIHHIFQDPRSSNRQTIAPTLLISHWNYAQVLKDPLQDLLGSKRYGEE